MLGYAASVIFLLYWILSCLILPYKASKRSQRSQTNPPAIPKTKQYRLSMINLSYITILAILTAYLNGMPVFGSIYIDHRISLIALGFLALNMSLIEPLEWKYISDEIKQRYGDYSPSTTNERFAWIPFSLIIAISEEILYRAVLFGIFYQLTDNYWIAGLISAALFAIAHWKYGLTALPSAFLVGLGLQYLVYISGGLYIAIAIHFIHNLVNGIVYGAIWKRKLEAEKADEIIINTAEMTVTAYEPD